MDLKKELVSGAGDCFCRRTSDEPATSCSNPECPIKVFHLACLSITNVPQTWLCPHCRKLPKFIRSAKGTKNQACPSFLEEALLLDTICLCKVKAKKGDKLLMCHDNSCSSGKFFHLNCLSYKRSPNNYNHWVCVSSIGCEKGFVNLYDNLFYDVILDDLEQQVRNLMDNLPYSDARCA